MTLSIHPRIHRPAPPKGARPLCAGCGAPLRPSYVTIWLSDGTSASLYRYTARPDDEAVRVWDGTWEGYGRRRVDDLPTHCRIGCAADHAVRLARMLAKGPVELNAEGMRRATHARPSEETEEKTS